MCRARAAQGFWVTESPIPGEAPVTIATLPASEVSMSASYHARRGERDIRRIDWAAYARTGDPVFKLSRTDEDAIGPATRRSAAR